MVTARTTQKRGLLGFIVDMLDSYFGLANTGDVSKIYSVGPAAGTAPADGGTEGTREVQELDIDPFRYFRSPPCCY